MEYGDDGEPIQPSEDRRPRSSSLCSPTTTVWEPVTAKKGLRLDHIEDNPKSVIETWQSIRNELMPRMADVDAVSAVELFGAHLTGAATRECVQILHDCAEKLYADIDDSFNERFAKWTIKDKANSIVTGAAFDAFNATKQHVPRLSKNGQPSKMPGRTAERIDQCQVTTGPFHWNHSSRRLQNQPRSLA